VLVRLLEKPAYRRLHSEQIEIVPGDRIAGDISYRIAPTQSPAGISIVAGEAAERGVSLPVILKRRIRRGQKFPARPRPGTQLVKVFRLAHVQGTQHHRVHYAEDENVGPDPHHQSDDGNKHERGRFPQPAQRITNIQ
jgi:hypothetical protein